MIGATVILSTAFALRGEHRLVPDRGIGYVLGLLGLGAMVTLLGYSARKRLGAARRWGRLQTWFRIHMFLGIAGPVAILLHCNFQLGSTNANVALASVLAVSGSGIVGRLLYGRIHAGLFGRRLTLLELRAAIEERKALLEAEGTGGVRIAMEPIERYERRALAPVGLIGSLARPLILPVARSRALYAATEGLAARERSQVAEPIVAYLRAVSRVSVFAACEQLFGLWHAVHLPLCLVLFMAAAAHVAAVHLY